MEETIKIFIYIHAFFGGIGLITGFASIIVKKGSKPHKNMGKLFSIGMLTSSFISMPISCLPNHKNVLLFLIGLFTIYLVISGNQMLSFKSKNKKSATLIDKIISGSMLLISIFMVLFGIDIITNGNKTGILFIFFSAFGLILTIGDFIYFKKIQKNKTAWLSNHAGKMIGAFIASVTAFIVAGTGNNNLIAWTLPSILGIFYIIYWKRKLKHKN